MLKLKFIVLFLYLSLSVMYAQKIYVVSIGIADYQEVNDLNLTENDVRLFNELMSSQGAEITTLLGNQATHVSVLSTMRASFAKAKKEDTMIFFFSGHGYEGGFCCWDMSGDRPESTSSLVRNAQDRKRLTAANKYYGGLSYAEMQILFRNCRAGKKIVFADACYSGGLHKGNQVDVSVQSARNGDVVFFLSSYMDETSLEMREGVNGLFTYYLAEGLLGESDVNKDLKITMKEIYDYVYRHVVAYANKISYSQHPVLWGKFNENMPIFNLTK